MDGRGNGQTKRIPAIVNAAMGIIKFWRQPFELASPSHLSSQQCGHPYLAVQLAIRHIAVGIWRLALKVRV